jgi:hypothetical protein
MNNKAARNPAHSHPKPTCWPVNVQYLDRYAYHSSIAPQIRLYLHGSSRSSTSIQNNRSLIQIRRISDKSHPASGQCGLFAAKKIPPNTHILDYFGEIHCEDRPNSDYDLSLYRSQDGTNVGIDASTMGNEARFINDYRGVRDKPNALFVNGRTTSGELRMSIWSGAAPIKKGGEILVSYGKGWWRARQSEGTA